MTETPQFFLNRQGRRLFGIVHTAEPARSTGIAVVYCAPLFEEKLWSHRVAVNFARFLAGRGIACLRFDYFGDGESEGLFEEASVTSRVTDILDAVEVCRVQARARSVFLLGVRCGATFALSAASADSVAGVVAWSPVMDGERYLTELLRMHLTAQMVVHRKVVHDRDELIRQIQAGRTVNIEGYEMSRGLYGELARLDVMAPLAASPKPILVQQISPDTRIESAYEPVRALDNTHVHFEHVRESKFWLQQKQIFAPCEALFERTASWLLSASPSAGDEGRS